MSIKESYENIADAIREAEGSSDPILQVDFPERIRALSGGGSSYTKEEIDAKVASINASIVGENINLLEYYTDYRYGNPYVNNNVTFTVNDDGSITAVTSDRARSSNSTYTISYRPGGNYPTLDLEVGKTYTLSGTPNTGTDVRMTANYTKNNAAVTLGVDYGSGTTFTVQEASEQKYGIVITIPASYINTEGITFYPMLEEGSERHPYQKVSLNRMQLHDDIVNLDVRVEALEDQMDKHTYSTDEKEVGTWIDGSIVYEKTYIDTVGASGEDKTIQLPAGTKDIIDITALFNNGNVYVQAPIHTQNASEYMYTYVIGGVYHFTHNVAAWAGRNMVVTIRYTKEG